LKEFEDFARTAASPASVMQHISERIHMHIPRYNWVGFYLVDKNDPTILQLGPYTGSFVPKRQISVNEGICGSAASMRRTIVCNNVAEDPRYVQAADLVKSQISTPLESGGLVLCVMNVESYLLATFKTPIEYGFVESCSKLVAACFPKAAARHLVNV